MSATMKLHQAGPSPFARKVRVVAHELGLADRIELVDVHVTPVKRNPEYVAKINPLRKVPALAMPDGGMLVDSTLICLYLDDLADHASLIGTGERRWEVLNAQEVANGMMEAAVAHRYENFFRPEEKRWEDWSADLLDRIEGGLHWFEARTASAPASSSADSIDFGTLSLGCLLGYLDFRQPTSGWRDRYPALARTFESLASRESFSGTTPES